jgi:exosortase/archaeosortase family protein
VPTDTAQDYRHNLAFNFALRGIAWSLTLFALVRLSFVEAHAVVPLTQLQARLAETTFGRPVLPIDITVACSGADALALCVGAILAYPASWPTRLLGAAGGITLILSINTARIGTLGRVAADASMFQLLHVYLWPAVLILAIAGYVFTWMGMVRPAEEQPRSSRRFVLLTATFLVLFAAASPFYLESAGVLAVAAFIARLAAAGLEAIGIHAVATANVLSTPRGGFLVTQECISTPLIPVYFAAVLAYPRSWRFRTLALLCAFPLFVGLGVARLLVVALPPALVSSPIFLIHAFYQLLLGATLVWIAAFWRHGVSVASSRRAAASATLGALSVYLLTPWYTHALTSVTASGGFDDPQGALAFLPPFQVGLYFALFAAATELGHWRSFLGGLALLAASQLALFPTLRTVAEHIGVTPYVRDVRALALAAPVLLLAAVVNYGRPRR